MFKLILILFFILLSPSLFAQSYTKLDYLCALKEIGPNGEVGLNHELKLTEFYHYINLKTKFSKQPDVKEYVTIRFENLHEEISLYFAVGPTWEAISDTIEGKSGETLKSEIAGVSINCSPILEETQGVPENQ